MDKLYFDFVNDLFNSEIAKRNNINNTTNIVVKILKNLIFSSLYKGYALKR